MRKIYGAALGRQKIFNGYSFVKLKVQWKKHSLVGAISAHCYSNGKVINFHSRKHINKTNPGNRSIGPSRNSKSQGVAVNEMRKDELFKEYVSHWRKQAISHIQAKERKFSGM